ncbi:hypothetical protein Gasu2_14760 [Galdieria sulphuraria]|uniref:t-SNARE coiled-coil homology domain-containing protein n=1 Tax=Galdieria sulphuraria TaxID=130081 RepID=M2XFG7_GALSU|nr:uncharacterized protein Gasu_38010 [Galdieria sulphuraria]EME28752.1 hypothetical protein Gasu_38010 [Galdieria sulphuraria]GJD07097.1 hypothetical protein Gasu2_14760 [Galdieria sulphuraria]|eukprot:XP_005705272.1 hypothetical protein Gasu_38010 [Galdieria sulphuraria]
MSDEEAQLDSIAAQVSRMAQTADLINREVDEQTKLLGSIGNQVQTAGELTHTTLRQVKDTGKNSEQRTIIICFLTIFLISVLIFLFLKFY